MVLRCSPRHVIATLALSILTGGCGTASVSLAEGPREYVATDYEAVLRNWTRSDELVVMSRLDKVLMVTATYESWDFRWAYAVRYAEDYRLTIDQRKSLLERSLSDSRRVHQFYIALAGDRQKWSILTKKDPAWVIRLIDNRGNETAPSDIQYIRRPGAIERTYFPYTSPWREAFRVRFPARRGGKPTIADNARWFGLRFAGPQGSQELVWEVDRKGNPVTSPAPRATAAP